MSYFEDVYLKRMNLHGNTQQERVQYRKEKEFNDLFLRKTQYDEADFSQAHLLDTFLKLREAAKDEAKEIEAIYYRSRKKKPYKYSRLIGGNKQNRRRFR